MVERLTEKHKVLDVPPEMYEMWLDSLCEAVGKHDPEYNDELEQQWREAMKPTIQRMIGGGRA